MFINSCINITAFCLRMQRPSAAFADAPFSIYFKRGPERGAFDCGPPLPFYTPWPFFPDDVRVHELNKKLQFTYRTAKFGNGAPLQFRLDGSLFVCGAGADCFIKEDNRFQGPGKGAE